MKTQRKKPSPRRARARGKDPLPPPERKFVPAEQEEVEHLISHDPALGRLFDEYLGCMAECQLRYRRMDELMGQILAQVRPGRLVKIPDGRVAALRDVFSEKVVVYRSHALRKYEVVVLGDPTCREPTME